MILFYFSNIFPVSTISTSIYLDRSHDAWIAKSDYWWGVQDISEVAHDGLKYHQILSDYNKLTKFIKHITIWGNIGQQAARKI